MNNEERELYLAKYIERTHFFGHIGLTISVLMFLAAPFIMGITLDTLPNMCAFWKGLTQIAIIYIPKRTRKANFKKLIQKPADTNL